MTVLPAVEQPILSSALVICPDLSKPFGLHSYCPAAYPPRRQKAGFKLQVRRSIFFCLVYNSLSQRVLEPFQQAASAISSFSFLKLLSKMMMSVTAGFPIVMVPFYRTMVSSLLAFLARAHLPVPAMIAVGVARPKAQGQAIPSPATRLIIAGVKSPVIPHHKAKVIKAVKRKAGTNIDDTLSAIDCIGGLLPWAS